MHDKHLSFIFSYKQERIHLLNKSVNNKFYASVLVNKVRSKVLDENEYGFRKMRGCQNQQASYREVI